MVVRYNGASDFVEASAEDPEVPEGFVVGAADGDGRVEAIGGRGSDGRRAAVFWTYR